MAHFLSRTRHVGTVILALLFLQLGMPVLADEVAEDVAGHVLLAEDALENHDYQRAAEEYRIAAEMSENVEIAMQATRIAYSYGFNDDAIRAARRWAELEPDSDEATLYVAQLYLRTGQIRDARKGFEKLLESGDEPAEERLLALIPVLARENADYAYELMRQLARPYQKSAFANYAVAVLALQAGDTKTAGERAKEAISIDPEWVKPRLLYARSLLLAGDEAGAIDYTSRLVGDSPDPDPEARLELAIMLVSAGRDDDALSQVNQILLEQPYRTDALRLMAIINFRQDRLDAAKADFEDLLASGNFRLDALYYLGRIADQRSEFDEAVDYYSQVSNGSNAVMAQSRAAVIIADQGEPDLALRYLEKFGATHPNYAVDMLRAKAQLLARLERFDEALEYYDQVISYRPDEESVHLGRAELLLRMGRLDDAIAQYRKAKDHWPDSAMTLNALGYTLADRTDRYREAEKLIRKALSMEPESPAIIDSLGWVLFRLGKYDEALPQLQKAYGKLNDPEVAGHIVETLMAMSRREEAIAVLEDAERLFPDSDYLQSLRDQYLTTN